MSWSSYENKQERPFKVMVKNLPETCDPIKIGEELTNRNFKVLDVTNILQWKTKKPLPMFRLAFCNDEDISKITAIKTIQGARVTIEPLKKSQLIPQCKNCQAWGHTRKFCHRAPRCVKCAGQHISNKCTKTKGDLPKCYNCGNQHPANYRGCEIIKELQKLCNDDNNKNKTDPKKKKLPTDKQHKEDNRSTPPTYAEIAQGRAAAKTDELSSINQTLQAILKKLDQQEHENQQIKRRLENLEKPSSRGAIPKARND